MPRHETKSSIVTGRSVALGAILVLLVATSIFLYVDNRRLHQSIDRFSSRIESSKDKVSAESAIGELLDSTKPAIQATPADAMFGRRGRNCAAQGGTWDGHVCWGEFGESERQTFILAGK